MGDLLADSRSQYYYARVHMGNPLAAVNGSRMFRATWFETRGFAALLTMRI